MSNALFDDEVLEFPVAWHGRIIACDLDHVADDIRRLLLAFGVDTEISRGNRSRAGRYVTYTVDIVFENRRMMQQIPEAIAKVTGVKMVL